MVKFQAFCAYDKNKPQKTWVQVQHLNHYTLLILLAYLFVVKIDISDTFMPDSRKILQNGMLFLMVDYKFCGARLQRVLPLGRQEVLFYTHFFLY